MLTLTALLLLTGLLLARLLAAVLTLSRLPGLFTLLALALLSRLLLSRLTTLLTLLFHIVCHEILLLARYETPRALNYSHPKLSCRNRLQGWEDFLGPIIDVSKSHKELATTSETRSKETASPCTMYSQLARPSRACRLNSGSGSAKMGNERHQEQH
jgi:hypothetical protein